MPNFVSAYTDDSTNTVVTVTEAFAQAKGLTTLKSDEPMTKRGEPRGPREVKRAGAKVRTPRAPRKPRKPRTTKTSATKATSNTKPNGGSAASNVEEN